MMEAALVVLLGGALAWLIKQGDRDQTRAQTRAWQEVALACGLQVVEVSSGWMPRLKARGGAMEVWIRRNSGETGLPTRIEILVHGPPDFHKVSIKVSVRAELTLWTRPIEIGGDSVVGWAPEIEIGDESFDRKFFLGGPPRLVLALLDAATRHLLVRVRAESTLEISSGMLRATVTDKSLHDVLVLLLNIGHRFAQVEIPRRLAENAKRDPEPGVRLQNLLLLIREFPGKAETVETLRTACSDPSPEIRLRAAKELGAEGRSVLLELAEGLLDDSVSAEAVSVLEGELSFTRTRTLLVRALSRRQILTARVCMEAIGRGGDPAAVDTLAEVLEEADAGLAAAAAEALGVTASPAAEAPLIAALRREQTAIQVAAAEALGRAGSAAAVLPLKEAAERSPFDLELRRVTRQAIAEIQSRVQGASPGQLSLAGTEAGQLSLADDPAGRLSLPGERPE